MRKKGRCSEQTTQCMQMIDFSLLKDPIFLIFAISNFLTSIGKLNVFIVVKRLFMGVSFSELYVSEVEV